jgi:hypothetical protein
VVGGNTSAIAAAFYAGLVRQRQMWNAYLNGMAAVKLPGTEGTRQRDMAVRARAWTAEGLS